MFRRNSGAGIADQNRAAALVVTQGNLDLAALWSKPKRVLDKISDCAVKKEWVREYVCLAFARYRDLPIFGGDFVKRLNFLERGAAVECRSINLLLGRLGAR